MQEVKDDSLTFMGKNMIGFSRILLPNGTSTYVPTKQLDGKTVPVMLSEQQCLSTSTLGQVYNQLARYLQSVERTGYTEEQLHHFAVDQLSK